MAPDRVDDALAPLAPGALRSIACGNLVVTIAPDAGGRIAQIHHHGAAQLVDAEDVGTSMIAWGCYPMVPWAGRVRAGRFAFDGRSHQLPPNLEGHAIHGVGFGMPWQVDTHDENRIAMSLALPEDARWPFGGQAHQRIEVGQCTVRMELSVRAGSHAMPAEIGWHPWFRKPEALAFAPQAMYPRDADGIAITPTVSPAPGPWDDCFVHRGTVVMHAGAHPLRLSSDCDHWVVYDRLDHATCVEPQSGPPDAFNLAPRVLQPGQALTRWFTLEWTEASRSSR